LREVPCFLKGEGVSSGRSPFVKGKVRELSGGRKTFPFLHEKGRSGLLKLRGGERRARASEKNFHVEPGAGRGWGEARYLARTGVLGV